MGTNLHDCGDSSEAKLQMTSFRKFIHTNFNLSSIGFKSGIKDQIMTRKQERQKKSLGSRDRLLFELTLVTSKNL